MDLAGKRFGKLTVIEYQQTNKNYRCWKCLCDCGNFSIVRTADLSSGHTKSCGCLQKSIASKSNYKHGFGNGDRLYRIFHGMKARCYNKKNASYKNYGGRNIKICDKWLEDFTNFREWAILNGYSSEKTIDRINVDGDYSPENCRWATKIQQANNKRNNHIVIFKGTQMTIAECSRITGIRQGKILDRLNLGWSIEKALESDKQEV